MTTLVIGLQTSPEGYEYYRNYALESVPPGHWMTGQGGLCKTFKNIWFNPQNIL